MKISKALSDYTWNFLSLGILAASGTLINVIILAFYSIDALGVFNQTYALFAIFSQLSVLGIHYSVLKSTSQKAANHKLLSGILIGGIFAVFCSSTIAAVIFYFSSSFFSDLLNSILINETIKIVTPALFLFSLNKVLASFINGLEKMKEFAIINITRYLGLIAFLLLFILLGFSQEDLMYMFLCSELLVFSLCIFLTSNYINFISYKTVISIAYEHILFGCKALLSGIFVELNFRIDVIVLGVFTSDAAVGIYSFFSLLAEGLYNVYVVIKNIINPKLAKLLDKNNFKDLKLFIFSAFKTVYLMSIFFIPMLTLGIYFLISFLPDANLLSENFHILIILFSFIFLISGFIPFEMILTLAGKPELQSLQGLMVCVINLILNLALVPIYQGIGAAISTGISFLTGILIIYIIASRKLGIKIF
jgi:O-antigen/teichoic acid export membrane protein